MQKKYLHSNIPQPINITLINIEIDSPMINEIQFDISCFINRFSVVPAKNPKEIITKGNLGKV